ncbi:hypothetical protein OEA41_009563 [Lepraria neglecta]|uniref:Myb-like domain-containing protein n=1 Tax=Lepraria neglecta TaxID=209136 RepID=A0AAD9Z4I5_9LECA|nr:hypothetical protein OEA41_009563 [Lepraria neglecta]
MSRPVRPQPTTAAPPMIQPQPPPQAYYTQSPYDPQPPQLQSGYQQPQQQQQQQQQQQLLAPQPPPQTQASPPNSRKRKAPGAAPSLGMSGMSAMSPTGLGDLSGAGQEGEEAGEMSPPVQAPKKSRTNTPWTPAEEQRLKIMRDAGNSWGEIAKSAALLAAIKEYEASKWKVIGQKVGKPAKACEQYAKEHFGGRI